MAKTAVKTAYMRLESLVERAVQNHRGNDWLGLKVTFTENSSRIILRNTVHLCRKESWRSWKKIAARYNKPMEGFYFQYSLGLFQLVRHSP